MKNRFFSLWLILLFTTLTQSARAVVIDDLYTVKLPVADQTTALRLEAFGEGFRQILTKISGSDEAQKSPGISRLVGSSARYVKQFSYFNRVVVDVDDIEQKHLYLKMDFDQPLVERLLREHNFPVWGRERPSSLLVINSQAGGSIQLVTVDSAPEIVELVDLAALQKGVPTLLPLMDLEDISLIDVADVTARNFNAINNMAIRYSPDAIVVGEVVEKTSESWKGAWEVRFADQIFKWRFQAGTQQEIIEQLVAHLARVLALEYALENHQRSDQDLFLRVSSVRDITDLISVQKYLGSLNVVESVRASLISEAEVTFRLKLRNSAEDLQRLIEFGNILEQQNLPQVNAQAEGGVVINYDFVGSVSN